jgi:hypothetical protein
MQDHHVAGPIDRPVILCCLNANSWATLFEKGESVRVVDVTAALRIVTKRPEDGPYVLSVVWILCPYGHTANHYGTTGAVFSGPVIPGGSSRM